MKKKTTNDKRPSKTSTPVTRKTNSLNISKSNLSFQHANTIPEASTRQYKVTAKQTRTWKPLDQELKDYLFKLIDTNVKTVGSKPVYVKDEDVQKVLSHLKKKLKASIDKIKVPKKKYKSFTELKHAAAELNEEYENLTNQLLEIEREIRQEERKVDALEDGIDVPELIIETPEDILNLPKMVFGRS